MSDLRQLTRRLAPVFLNLLSDPYWVCLCEPPATPGTTTPPERALEFWTGGSFDDWYPEPDCAAIFAVLSGTVFAGRLPLLARRRRPGSQRVHLVCAVSRNGEAYAAVAIPTGRGFVEGTPNGGRLLDALLSKFGYPPGLECTHDLDIGSCE